MTLPPIAPSVDRRTEWITPISNRVPTSSEWATLYPEIERLYVREHRKLRYVMRYVETKYGLKATHQMYKKRFAKWGFQKNARRSATSMTPSTTTTSGNSSPSANTSPMPISPKLSNDDSLKLMFLSSVQIWSTSFFESLQSKSETLALRRQSFSEQSEEMNFTFKLVIDLLNRGHGVLAGRVARKAFLLVEETLMLEGPALVWNVLEIMHYMVKVRHLELLQLLLAHMIAFVDGRMPRNHPLPTMLQALRVFVKRLPGLASGSRDSTLTSCLPFASLDKSEVTSAVGHRLVSGTILSMIERAWTLNAEILFNHFDHRLFQLYFRIHWESCSIEPPTTIIGATKQWLTHTTSQHIYSLTKNANKTGGFIQITPFEEDRMLQSLFTTPTDASPPPNFELLRISSIASLQDHASSILAKSPGLTSDTTTLLAILAVLVMAKVLEEWPAFNDLTDMKISMTSRISRAQAGSVACAVKTQWTSMLNAKDSNHP